MEDKKEEGEAEIQEHGPEHWFSKWERQCLAEAEQEEPLEEEAEQSQQKLWHLFQNSATAVAQLYKGQSLLGYDEGGNTRASRSPRSYHRAIQPEKNKMAEDRTGVSALSPAL